MGYSKIVATTLLSIIMIFPIVYVNATSEAPQLLWENTFGTGNRDEATCVIQTNDGGYLVIGSMGHGYFPRTVFMVKTDSSGNMKWNQQFDDLDSVSAVVQSSDGGYAFAGNGKNGFVLSKTDSQGVLGWKKTYTVSFMGSNGGIALGMVKTNDGGYALAGSCASGLYGDNRNNAFLVKTSSSGTVQWTKTYGGVGIDYARAVVQTSDGGYAMAGSTSSYGAGDFDYWLIRTDQQGNILWNQTFGTGPKTENPTSLNINTVGDDEAYSLVETNDNGYALVGTTFSFGSGSSDAWIVKTDSSGNMQWNKTYGAAGNEAASCIIKTSDDGFTFAGSAPHYAGTVSGFIDAWLVKIDSIGNMEWNQTFGGAPPPQNPNSSFANSLIETSDGGFALAGSTNIGSSSSGGYYYLVKTSSVLPPPSPTITLVQTPSPSTPFSASTLTLITFGALAIVLALAILFVIYRKQTRIRS
jgi:hypothetical protein